MKGPLAVGGVLLLGFDVFIVRPDPEEGPGPEDGSGPEPTPSPRDTDADGVPDDDDACPGVAGPGSDGGCPDTDGDGMSDDRDACPEFAGPAEFGGCPDSDGDGLPDTTDACPNLPGLETFSGCPDTDDDGVPDGRDVCPRIKGDPLQRGCPGLPDEARVLFEGSIPDLRFEGESDRLRPEAQPAIARLSSVLVQYSHLQIEIRVHSHGKRSRKKAWSVSQRRAEAVKQRLVESGADPRRLTAIGMGPDHPVDSNRTRVGRQRNDRVELRLVE